MLGASRTSMAALQESLTARFDSATMAEFDEAGKGLLSIVDVLDSERALRSTLSDSSISREAKARLVEQLFSGKVSPLAIEVFMQIVTSRWSSEADMIDATEEAGATLILMGAEKAGHIDQVEEELFRFGRAIHANASLQMALTDPASPPAGKSGLARSLLEGKASPETVLLVAHVAGSLRGRPIQDALERLSELAAARRGREIAEVISAIELTPEQEQRLKEALTKLHGRQVELNIAIDPTVIGGIEVRIGDEVIDGTAATKLEQARRRLAG